MRIITIIFVVTFAEKKREILGSHLSLEARRSHLMDHVILENILLAERWSVGKIHKIFHNHSFFLRKQADLINIVHLFVRWDIIFYLSLNIREISKIWETLGKSPNVIEDRNIFSNTKYLKRKFALVSIFASFRLDTHLLPRHLLFPPFRF